MGKVIISKNNRIKYKMHNTRTIKILVAVGLLITITGCKVKEKVKIDDLRTHEEVLLQEVLEAEPAFENIHFMRMNVGVNLNGKGRYNSAANCKIITDSVIHISVRPFFGIEMFIVQLTPARMVLVDKTKNLYYQSDYLIFEDLFDMQLDYKTFESLLTNKLFTMQMKNQEKPLKPMPSDRKNERILTYKNVSLTQHFLLNENNRIREIEIKSNEGAEQFRTYYTDFVTVGKLVLPSNIRLQLNNESKKFNFNVSISQMEVDGNIDIPFLNANLYRQADIKSLLD